MLRLARTTALVAALACSLSGCMFASLKHDLRRHDELWSLEGTVSLAPTMPQQARTVVVLYQELAGKAVPLDRLILEKPGAFEFLLEARNVRVFAFADVNGDLRHQPGEPIGDNGAWIDLTSANASSRSDRRWRFVDVTMGEAETRVPSDNTRPSQKHRSLHLGTVVDLDDPRFGPELAHKGVWEPWKTILEHGAGLFLLGPYRPDAIPVFFVHGFDGYPQQFRQMIEALPDGFQPWVVQYPSGWNLEQTAEYAERLLEEARQQYGLTRACIVAHSMGGVMVHRALGIRSARKRSEFVHVVVTIASPFGGMESAQTGVENAPRVVPSWRSLVPGSPFLLQVERSALPAHTRWLMVTASNDTTVPQSSQRPAWATRTVDASLTIAADHTEILDNDSLKAHLYAELTQTTRVFPAQNPRLSPPERHATAGLVSAPATR